MSKTSDSAEEGREIQDRFELRFLWGKGQSLLEAGTDQIDRMGANSAG